MTVLVSTRGYNTTTSLIELDLENKTIKEKIEIDCGLPQSVPQGKRGFTELRYVQPYIVAATWDRICWIDPTSYKVVYIVSDYRFSDIHSVFVEDCGLVWLTSTNLDGIYTVREGQVDAYWHVWDEVSDKFPKINSISDYRNLGKQEIPFHQLHVNSVYPTKDYVFITYLGPRRKINRFYQKIIQHTLYHPRVHDGGLFVIDRKSKKIIKQFRLEGLHNSIEFNRKLVFTEFFSNALVFLDLESLSIQRLKLRVPCYKEWGYLSRGVFPINSIFWIGHTALRGWRDENPMALIRDYLPNGKWIGNEIKIPGVAGVYDIIQIP